MPTQNISERPPNIHISLSLPPSFHTLTHSQFHLLSLSLSVIAYLYKKRSELSESGISSHLRRKRGSVSLPSELWLQNVIYWADASTELAVLVPAVEAARPTGGAAQLQQQAPVGPSPTHSAYMTPSASTQLLENADASGGGSGRVPDVLAERVRTGSTAAAIAKAPADSDTSAPQSPTAGTKITFKLEPSPRGEPGESADTFSGSGGHRAQRSSRNANTSTFGSKAGAQSGLLTNGDPKVCVVWLERFEDRDTLPVKDLLMYAVGRAILPPASSTSSATLNERDVFVICLHVLRRSGLIRVSVQNSLSLAASSRASPARGGTPAGSSSLPGPLLDGMVVSRAALAPLLRQTVLNIYRRRRLEASTDPPHVRRKTRINEMLKKYRCRIGESDFFVSLFQEPY